MKHEPHMVTRIKGKYCVVGSFSAMRWVFRYAYTDRQRAVAIAKKLDGDWDKYPNEQRTLEDIAANYIGEEKAIGYAGVKNDKNTWHVVPGAYVNEKMGYFDWAKSVRKMERAHAE